MTLEGTPGDAADTDVAVARYKMSIQLSSIRFRFGIVFPQLTSSPQSIFAPAGCSRRKIKLPRLPTGGRRKSKMSTFSGMKLLISINAVNP
jgi:hypothetical protein